MGDRTLFLGKEFDPATEALGELYHLDPDDLTTHGFIVGMTGSGKTGLSIVLIEELLRQGIPVIAIDPKGDLANLALAFDRLAPDQFAAWVPPEEGDDGSTIARTWSTGLSDWGIDAATVADYVERRSISIITPGSSAGTPLNVLNSLQPSAATAGQDLETVREEIDSIVSGLLGFIDIEADPVASREYILLFTLIEDAWKAGRPLDLPSLVGLVANPPIEKVGALPLEAFYPAKDRTALMMKLNNLVASPPFEAWRTGEPIDFERWLGPGSKTPLTVVYTAHLDDRERMFATTLLLTKLVTWMRSQPGRDSLRCLLYFDEVFGYFPPVANPPSKQPLLTLLKQARAFGVGVMLATQNPVDVDYRGLANIGYWAIGRLQTPQDRNRVASGIKEALAESGAPDLESLLANAQKRVFLIHNAHESGPKLIHTRWAMSYLRGPVTRDEIRKLQPGLAAAPPAVAATQSIAVESPIAEAAARTTHAPIPAAAPVVPGSQPFYLRRDGGTSAAAYAWMRVSARYKMGRSGAAAERSLSIAYPLSNLADVGELFEATVLEVDESQLDRQRPAGLAFLDVPAEVVANGLKALDRVVRDRLDDALAVEVLYDPESKLWGGLGEHENDFALRIAQSPGERKKRDRLEERLAKKRSDLALKSQEISGRRMEKWASIGGSILSNLRILTGRKRTVTGVGGVLSKSRMEGTARQRKERLEAEIAELERQIEELGEVDPSRFETRTVKPARADVSELRRELIWVY